MKKIKALQLLVYVTFTLFMLQHVAPAMLHGFKEGYNDGYYAGRHNDKQRGPLVTAILNGDLIKKNFHPDTLTSKNYQFEDVSINANLRLTPIADTTPWWLTIVDVVVVFGIVALLFAVAFTINKIIVKIVDGTMFDDKCVALIKKTASLLLIYALADYAFEQINFFETDRLIPAPFKAINTAEFNFPVLVCAAIIYLIAEAFKQGANLKAEQDLTI